jgi:hypothetical protein
VEEMSDSMDSKERAKFDNGFKHGVAMAMLSAGLHELAVDEKHALWSYTHRMSVSIGADGARTYMIEAVDPGQPVSP